MEKDPPGLTSMSFRLLVYCTFWSFEHLHSIMPQDSVMRYCDSSSGVTKSRPSRVIACMIVCLLSAWTLEGWESSMGQQTRSCRNGNPIIRREPALSPAMTDSAGSDATPPGMP